MELLKQNRQKDPPPVTLFLGRKKPTRLHQAKGKTPGQQLQARTTATRGAFAVIFAKGNFVLRGSRIDAFFFDLEWESLVRVLSQNYRNKQLIFL